MHKRQIGDYHPLYSIVTQQDNTPQEGTTYQDETSYQEVPAFAPSPKTSTSPESSSKTSRKKSLALHDTPSHETTNLDSEDIIDQRILKYGKKQGTKRGMFRQCSATTQNFENATTSKENIYLTKKITGVTKKAVIKQKTGRKSKLSEKYHEWQKYSNRERGKRSIFSQCSVVAQNIPNDSFYQKAGTRSKAVADPDDNTDRITQQVTSQVAATYQQDASYEEDSTYHEIAVYQANTMQEDHTCQENFTFKQVAKDSACQETATSMKNTSSEVTAIAQGAATYSEASLNNEGNNSPQTSTYIKAVTYPEDSTSKDIATSDKNTSSQIAVISQEAASYTVASLINEDTTSYTAYTEFITTDKATTSVTPNYPWASPNNMDAIVSEDLCHDDIISTELSIHHENITSETSRRKTFALHSGKYLGVQNFTNATSKEVDLYQEYDPYQDDTSSQEASNLDSDDINDPEASTSKKATLTKTFPLSRKNQRIQKYGKKRRKKRNVFYQCSATAQKSDNTTTSEEDIVYLTTKSITGVTKKALIKQKRSAKRGRYCPSQCSGPTQNLPKTITLEDIETLGRAFTYNHEYSKLSSENFHKRQKYSKRGCGEKGISPRYSVTTQNIPNYTFYQWTATHSKDVTDPNDTTFRTTQQDTSHYYYQPITAYKKNATSKEIANSDKNTSSQMDVISQEAASYTVASLIDEDTASYTAYTEFIRKNKATTSVTHNYPGASPNDVDATVSEYLSHEDIISPEMFIHHENITSADTFRRENFALHSGKRLVLQNFTNATSKEDDLYQEDTSSQEAANLDSEDINDPEVSTSKKTTLTKTFSSSRKKQRIQKYGKRQRGKKRDVFPQCSATAQKSENSTTSEEDIVYLTTKNITGVTKKALIKQKRSDKRGRYCPPQCSSPTQNLPKTIKLEDTESLGRAYNHEYSKLMSEKCHKMQKYSKRGRVKKGIFPRYSLTTQNIPNYTFYKEDATDNDVTKKALIKTVTTDKTTQQDNISHYHYQPTTNYKKIATHHANSYLEVAACQADTMQEDHTCQENFISIKVAKDSTCQETATFKKNTSSQVTTISQEAATYSEAPLNNEVTNSPQSYTYIEAVTYQNDSTFKEIATSNKNTSSELAVISQEAASYTVTSLINEDIIRNHKVSTSVTPNYPRASSNDVNTIVSEDLSHEDIISPELSIHHENITFAETSRGKNIALYSGKHLGVHNCTNATSKEVNQYNPYQDDTSSQESANLDSEATNDPEASTSKNVTMKKTFPLPGKTQRIRRYGKRQRWKKTNVFHQCSATAQKSENATTSEDDIVYLTKKNVTGVTKKALIKQKRRSAKRGRCCPHQCSGPIQNLPKTIKLEDTEALGRAYDYLNDIAYDHEYSKLLSEKCHKRQKHSKRGRGKRGILPRYSVATQNIPNYPCQDDANLDSEDITDLEASMSKKSVIKKTVPLSGKCQGMQKYRKRHTQKRGRLHQCSTTMQNFRNATTSEEDIIHLTTKRITGVTKKTLLKRKRGTAKSRGKSALASSVTTQNLSKTIELKDFHVKLEDIAYNPEYSILLSEKYHDRQKCSKNGKGGKGIFPPRMMVAPASPNYNFYQEDASDSGKVTKQDDNIDAEQYNTLQDSANQETLSQEAVVYQKNATYQNVVAYQADNTLKQDSTCQKASIYQQDITLKKASTSRENTTIDPRASTSKKPAMKKTVSLSGKYEKTRRNKRQRMKLGTWTDIIHKHDAVMKNFRNAKYGNAEIIYLTTKKITGVTKKALIKQKSGTAEREEKCDFQCSVTTQNLPGTVKLEETQTPPRDLTDTASSHEAAIYQRDAAYQADITLTEDSICQDATTYQENVTVSPKNKENTFPETLSHEDSICPESSVYHEDIIFSETSKKNTFALPSEKYWGKQNLSSTTSEKDDQYQEYNSCQDDISQKVANLDSENIIDQEASISKKATLKKTVSLSEKYQETQKYSKRQRQKSGTKSSAFHQCSATTQKFQNQTNATTSKDDIIHPTIKKIAGVRKRAVIRQKSGNGNRGGTNALRSSVTTKNLSRTIELKDSYVKLEVIAYNPEDSILLSEKYHDRQKCSKRGKGGKGIFSPRSMAVPASPNYNFYQEDASDSGKVTKQDDNTDAEQYNTLLDSANQETLSQEAVVYQKNATYQNVVAYQADNTLKQDSTCQKASTYQQDITLKKASTSRENTTIDPRASTSKKPAMKKTVSLSGKYEKTRRNKRQRMKLGTWTDIIREHDAVMKNFRNAKYGNAEIIYLTTKEITGVTKKALIKQKSGTAERGETCDFQCSVTTQNLPGTIKLEETQTLPRELTDIASSQDAAIYQQDADYQADITFPEDSICQNNNTYQENVTVSPKNKENTFPETLSHADSICPESSVHHEDIIFSETSKKNTFALPSGKYWGKQNLSSTTSEEDDQYQEYNSYQDDTSQKVANFDSENIIDQEASTSKKATMKKTVSLSEKYQGTHKYSKRQKQKRGTKSSVFHQCSATTQKFQNQTNATTSKDDIIYPTIKKIADVRKRALIRQSRNGNRGGTNALRSNVTTKNLSRTIELKDYVKLEDIAYNPEDSILLSEKYHDRQKCSKRGKGGKGIFPPCSMAVPASPNYNFYQKDASDSGKVTKQDDNTDAEQYNTLQDSANQETLSQEAAIYQKNATYQDVAAYQADITLKLDSTCQKTATYQEDITFKTAATFRENTTIDPKASTSKKMAMKKTVYLSGKYEKTRCNKRQRMKLGTRTDIIHEHDAIMKNFRNAKYGNAETGVTKKALIKQKSGTAEREEKGAFQCSVTTQNLPGTIKLEETQTLPRELTDIASSQDAAIYQQDADYQADITFTEDSICQNTNTYQENVTVSPKNKENTFPETLSHEDSICPESSVHHEDIIFSDTSKKNTFVLLSGKYWGEQNLSSITSEEDDQYQEYNPYQDDTFQKVANLDSENIIDQMASTEKRQKRWTKSSVFHQCSATTQNFPNQTHATTSKGDIIYLTIKKIAGSRKFALIRQKSRNGNRGGTNALQSSITTKKLFRCIKFVKVQGLPSPYGCLKYIVHNPEYSILLSGKYHGQKYSKRGIFPRRSVDTQNFPNNTYQEPTENVTGLDDNTDTQQNATYQEVAAYHAYTMKKEATTKKTVTSQNNTTSKEAAISKPTPTSPEISTYIEGAMNNCQEALASQEFLINYLQNFFSKAASTSQEDTISQKVTSNSASLNNKDSFPELFTSQVSVYQETITYKQEHTTQEATVSQEPTTYSEASWNNEDTISLKTATCSEVTVSNYQKFTAHLQDSTSQEAVIYSKASWNNEDTTSIETYTYTEASSYQEPANSHEATAHQVDSTSKETADSQTSQKAISQEADSYSGAYLGNDTTSSETSTYIEITTNNYQETVTSEEDSTSKEVVPFQQNSFKHTSTSQEILKADSLNNEDTSPKTTSYVTTFNLQEAITSQEIADFFTTTFQKAAISQETASYSEAYLNNDTTSKSSTYTKATANNYKESVTSEKNSTFEEAVTYQNSSKHTPATQEILRAASLNNEDNTSPETSSYVTTVNLQKHVTLQETADSQTSQKASISQEVASYSEAYLDNDTTSSETSTYTEVTTNNYQETVTSEEDSISEEVVPFQQNSFKHTSTFKEILKAASLNNKDNTSPETSSYVTTVNLQDHVTLQETADSQTSQKASISQEAASYSEAYLDNDTTSSETSTYTEVTTNNYQETVTSEEDSISEEVVPFQQNSFKHTSTSKEILKAASLNNKDNTSPETSSYVTTVNLQNHVTLQETADSQTSQKASISQEAASYSEAYLDNDTTSSETSTYTEVTTNNYQETVTSEEDSTSKEVVPFQQNSFKHTSTSQEILKAASLNNEDNTSPDASYVTTINLQKALTSQEIADSQTTTSKEETSYPEAYLNNGTTSETSTYTEVTTNNYKKTVTSKEDSISEETITYQQNSSKHTQILRAASLNNEDNTSRETSSYITTTNLQETADSQTTTSQKAAIFQEAASYSEASLNKSNTASPEISTYTETTMNKMDSTPESSTYSGASPYNEDTTFPEIFSYEDTLYYDGITTSQASRRKNFTFQPRKYWGVHYFPAALSEEDYHLYQKATTVLEDITEPDDNTDTQQDNEAAAYQEESILQKSAIYQQDATYQEDITSKKSVTYQEDSTSHKTTDSQEDTTSQKVAISHKATSYSAFLNKDTSSKTSYTKATINNEDTISPETSSHDINFSESHQGNTFQDTNQDITSQKVAAYQTVTMLEKDNSYQETATSEQDITFWTDWKDITFKKEVGVYQQCDTSQNDSTSQKDYSCQKVSVNQEVTTSQEDANFQDTGSEASLNNKVYTSKINREQSSSQKTPYTEANTNNYQETTTHETDTFQIITTQDAAFSQETTYSKASLNNENSTCPTALTCEDIITLESFLNHEAINILKTSVPTTEPDNNIGTQLDNTSTDAVTYQVITTLKENPFYQEAAKHQQDATYQEDITSKKSVTYQEDSTSHKTTDSQEDTTSQKVAISHKATSYSVFLNKDTSSKTSYTKATINNEDTISPETSSHDINFSESHQGNTFQDTNQDITSQKVAAYQTVTMLEKDNSYQETATSEQDITFWTDWKDITFKKEVGVYQQCDTSQNDSTSQKDYSCQKVSVNQEVTTSQEDANFQDTGSEASLNNKVYTSKINREQSSSQKTPYTEANTNNYQETTTHETDTFQIITTQDAAFSQETTYSKASLNNENSTCPTALTCEDIITLESFLNHEAINILKTSVPTTEPDNNIGTQLDNTSTDAVTYQVITTLKENPFYQEAAKHQQDTTYQEDINSKAATFQIITTQDAAFSQETTYSKASLNNENSTCPTALTCEDLITLESFLNHEAINILKTSVPTTEPDNNIGTQLDNTSTDAVTYQVITTLKENPFYQEAAKHQQDTTYQEDINSKAATFQIITTQDAAFSQETTYSKASLNNENSTCPTALTYEDIITLESFLNHEAINILKTSVPTTEPDNNIGTQLDNTSTDAVTYQEITTLKENPFYQEAAKHQQDATYQEDINSKAAYQQESTNQEAVMYQEDSTSHQAATFQEITTLHEAATFLETLTYEDIISLESFPNHETINVVKTSVLTTELDNNTGPQLDNTSTDAVRHTQEASQQTASFQNTTSQEAANNQNAVTYSESSLNNKYTTSIETSTTVDIRTNFQEAVINQEVASYQKALTYQEDSTSHKAATFKEITTPQDAGISQDVAFYSEATLNKKDTSPETSIHPGASLNNEETIFTESSGSHEDIISSQFIHHGDVTSSKTYREISPLHSGKYRGVQTFYNPKTSKKATMKKSIILSGRCQDGQKYSKQGREKKGIFTQCSLTVQNFHDYTSYQEAAIDSKDPDENTYTQEADISQEAASYSEATLNIGDTTCPETATYQMNTPQDAVFYQLDATSKESAIYQQNATYQQDTYQHITSHEDFAYQVVAAYQEVITYQDDSTSQKTATSQQDSISQDNEETTSIESSGNHEDNISPQSVRHGDITSSKTSRKTTPLYFGKYSIQTLYNPKTSKKATMKKSIILSGKYQDGQNYSKQRGGKRSIKRGIFPQRSVTVPNFHDYTSYQEITIDSKDPNDNTDTQQDICLETAKFQKITSQEAAFCQLDATSKEVATYQAHTTPQEDSTLQEADTFQQDTSYLDIISHKDFNCQVVAAYQEVITCQDDSIPQETTIYQEDSSTYPEASLNNEETIYPESSRTYEDIFLQSIHHGDITSLKTSGEPSPLYSGKYWGIPIFYNPKTSKKATMKQSIILSGKYQNGQKYSKQERGKQSIKRGILPQCSVTAPNFHDYASYQETAIDSKDPEGNTDTQQDNTCPETAIHQKITSKEAAFYQLDATYQQDASYQDITSCEDFAYQVVAAYQEVITCQDDSTSQDTATYKKDSTSKENTTYQGDSNIKESAISHEDTTPERPTYREAIMKDSTSQQVTAYQEAGTCQNDSTSQETAASHEAVTYQEAANSPEATIYSETSLNGYTTSPEGSSHEDISSQFSKKKSIALCNGKYWGVQLFANTTSEEFDLYQEYVPYQEVITQDDASSQEAANLNSEHITDPEYDLYQEYITKDTSQVVANLDSENTIDPEASTSMKDTMKNTVPLSGKCQGIQKYSKRQKWKTGKKRVQCNAITKNFRNVTTSDEDIIYLTTKKITGITQKALMKQIDKRGYRFTGTAKRTRKNAPRSSVITQNLPSTMPLEEAEAFDANSRAYVYIVDVTYNPEYSTLLPGNYQGQKYNGKGNGITQLFTPFKKEATTDSEDVTDPGDITFDIDTAAFKKVTMKKTVPSEKVHKYSTRGIQTGIFPPITTTSQNSATNLENADLDYTTYDTEDSAFKKVTMKRTVLMSGKYQGAQMYNKRCNATTQNFLNTTTYQESGTESDDISDPEDTNYDPGASTSKTVTKKKSTAFSSEKSHLKKSIPFEKAQKYCTRGREKRGIKRGIFPRHSAIIQNFPIITTSQEAATNLENVDLDDTTYDPEASAFKKVTMKKTVLMPEKYQGVQMYNKKCNATNQNFSNTTTYQESGTESEDISDPEDTTYDPGASTSKPVTKKKSTAFSAEKYWRKRAILCKKNVQRKEPVQKKKPAIQKKKPAAPKKQSAFENIYDEDQTIERQKSERIKSGALGTSASDAANEKREFQYITRLNENNLGVNPPSSSSEEEENLLFVDKKERNSRRKVKIRSHYKKTFDNYIVEEMKYRETNNITSPWYVTAAVPPSIHPRRQFCTVCGLKSTYSCAKCGTKYCGTECFNIHKDTRCLKWVD